MIGAGSGESPDKVSVGDAYTFSVDSPTSPHVEVLGPARRPVAVQVSNYFCKKYYFSFSFTLYPAHSRADRGNLVLRHSVPHFLPNSGGIAC